MTEISRRPEREGFDALVEDEADDLLGYRHLATRLRSLLIDTPPTWSVRVGLLGDWGSGKSTVARWVQKLAERDGHLVAWFSPTSSVSTDELWAAFAQSLLAAADRQKLAHAATSRLRTFVMARDTTRRVAAAAGANKITQSVHSTVTKFLEIGPGHLRDIREALGVERRVIVVIDDLDRIDPKILPNLLLALRVRPETT